MSRYRFHTLDVFTDVPFGGNPLAVVLDADGLSSERMQTLAGEFNLSETVFVLNPAKAGSNRRKLRIFTPQAELPFAGHPTVGTSYLLARLSLSEADLLPGHAAWSCGVPFLFIPVRDRDAIARAKLRTDLWEKLLSGWWARSVFPFTTDTVSKAAQIHARMFAPAMGVAEDPATGSAASAVAGYLHALEQQPDGHRRWLIEQGFEMGRPSLIELEAEIAGGGIAAVRVGGSSVLVSDGWINAGG